MRFLLWVLLLTGCAPEPEAITRTSVELRPHDGDALTAVPSEFVVSISGPKELVRPVLSVSSSVRVVRPSDGQRWDLAAADSPGNQTYSGSEFQFFATPAGPTSGSYEFVVALSDWGVPVDGSCTSGRCLVKRGDDWVAAFTLTLP
ncbi:MAG: hypothetical protein Q8L48_01045 [Archangium sp.]|nr:hypothetical protein [Archangium sp.]